MKFFLPITFCLYIFGFVVGKEIRRERNIYDDELSYQELINLNISCYPADSCEEGGKDHSPLFIQFETQCSCHSQCWEYGTCCIDSPYRFKPPIQKCYPALQKYLIYACPENTRSNSIWKIHCEREWNGENDIVMRTPVTSLDTSRSYKNYYCFRCHETSNKYLSWDLALKGSRRAPKDANVDSLVYNQENSTWMAIFDEVDISIPVHLEFRIPDGVQDPLYCCPCLIDDCPDTWTDKIVHKKCLEYASVLYTQRTIYKNVHCAICNSKPFQELVCEPNSFWGTIVFSGYFIKQMINVNSDETCMDDEVWDPYGGKCKKMKCLVPGRVIRNGECVKP